jgi:hypothetical protein
VHAQLWRLHNVHAGCIHITTAQSVFAAAARWPQAASLAKKMAAPHTAVFQLARLAVQQQAEEIKQDDDDARG